MRALTLWPEWAWAITWLGKNVENRTWKPNLEIGERFAIHAGSSFGGPALNRLSWDAVFNPVAGMARRANWMIGYNRRTHAVDGYRTDSANAFSIKVADIPMGAIVAVATFLGTLDNSKPIDHVWWADGMVGWVFDEVDTLSEPVKCRGRQRLWTIPDEQMAEVDRQAAAFPRFRTQ